MRHLVTSLCALLTGLLAAAPASALNLEYSLRGGVGYSDNINESALDPTGAGMLIPELDFSLDETGSVLRAKAAGSIQYFVYLGGGFSNQPRGDVSGIFDWAIFPERLHFVLQDDASVQPVNVLEPNAPGNLQQVNVVSLGPTLQFRLGPSLNGQADFRVLNSVASKTDEFNSLREIATLRAIRDVSPTQQLSANVEGQHVHFTGQTGNGEDYNRYDAFGRYHSTLASLDLDFSLGYSHLDINAVGGRSNPLVRGKVDWRATPRSTFGLDFARNYSDAAQDLSNIDINHIVEPANGIVVGQATINSEIYLERRVEGSYRFGGDRFAVNVVPFWHKLDYLFDAGLDQTGHGGSLDLSYRLERLLTLGVLIAEETRNYNVLDRRDEDIRAGVYVLKQLSRHWSWRLDLARNERNSTAAFQGFSENIGLFTLIFTR